MTTNQSTPTHTHAAVIDGQPVTIWDRRDLEPPFAFTWCYDCQEWIKPRCPRHHIDAFAK